MQGLECDQRISKLSEEKLREILEEVRKLRNRRKKKMDDYRREEEGKEVLYINSQTINQSGQNTVKKH